MELIVEKPAEEKSAPVEKKSIEEQPVLKKTPLPIPLKPKHLKERLQKLREEQSIPVIEKQPAPVIKKDSVPEEPLAPIEQSAPIEK